MKRFINNNFTSFAVGSLTLSMAAGWWCLSIIQDKQKERLPQQAASVLDDSPRVKSREELRLRAMVENALNSTSRENLDNAFHAQERFMLPGRDHGGDPKFVTKIDRRCDELMKQQQSKTQLQQDGEDSEGDLEKHQNKIQFWK
ncbi:expressed unknown protein [Seminavis robusta]|uniref:Uncharacterized protein n=1 Tax=Seminavis robusta TaxID=568900 RepID=A0A9N8HJ46_9STRA|nr:expressed unknown protein [Seminavis robusta]|eukprot:Sro635_g179110.1 n/a (144) ;mRNA; r:20904-21335